MIEEGFMRYCMVEVDDPETLQYNLKKHYGMILGNEIYGRLKNMFTEDKREDMPAGTLISTLIQMRKKIWKQKAGIETKLSEADHEAEVTSIRYSANEVFGRVRAKIK